MSPRDVAERAGAAYQFLDIARLALPTGSDGSGYSAEAQVSSSNSILAGIAAADAICGKVLGERANDSNHEAAIKLLASVVPDGKLLGLKLQRLLRDKSVLQYGGYSTGAKAEEMYRQADNLVTAMGGFGIRRSE